jgi:FkbM family methyltransferase
MPATSRDIKSTSPRAMSIKAFVAALYRVCVGRPADPVAGRVVDIIRRTRRATRARKIDSPECAARSSSDPSGTSQRAILGDDDLRVYAGFKRADLAVLEEFDGADPVPSPGFVTDFIGSRSRISSLWDGVQHLDGLVLPKPIPSDYHAETIEWLGVLKSVIAARRRFAAMEIGAGMGPWLVVSATAARLRGIRDIRLTGVEADPGRFQLMVQHLRDNGIDPDAQTLIEGAVGVASGVAKWPRISSPRNVAGARPVRQGVAGQELNQDDLRYLDGMMSELVEVNVVSFESLLRKQQFWDLVHIDVQGGEYDLCRACLALLAERVRYLIIGTHSRKLDGDLLDLMWRGGWILEHEKPTRFEFCAGVSSLERMGTHDGTQIWRNPDY